MSGSSINTIFFDAGGTLFEVRGNVGAVYRETALRYGIDAGAARLQAGFLTQFRAQPPLAFPRGLAPAVLLQREKKWWRELVAAVFAEQSQAPGFADFFDDVYEQFRGAAAWRLYEDVAPALARLRARGYRLAVVSNFDTRLDDLLRELDLTRYFEAVYLSTRMGAAKPDPLIFQAALADLGVPPACALHVGDSLREDIHGAMAAGVQAVLIDRTATNDHTDTSYRRIRRFDELPDAL
ncbi:MAG: HAD-IA family hydrolase [Blastocatellia bacterium]